MYSLLIRLLAVGVRLVAITSLVSAGRIALAWFAFTFIPQFVLFAVPINSLAILYVPAAVFVFYLRVIPLNCRLAFRRSLLVKSLATTNFDGN